MFKEFNSHEDMKYYETQRARFFRSRMDVFVKGNIFDIYKLKWKEKFNKEYKNKLKEYADYKGGYWIVEGTNNIIGTTYDIHELESEIDCEEGQIFITFNNRNPDMVYSYHNGNMILICLDGDQYLDNIRK